MANIKDLIIEEKTILLNRLFFVATPGNLCKLPYPGHPKGCPNWNISPNCPPRAKRIERKYNLKKPCYLSLVKFDLAAQEKRLLHEHPGWTRKQARCCLYWQKSVKRVLKDNCILFCKDTYPGQNVYDYELIPEAMGLHVFQTAQHHGIPIQRDIGDYVYKIAFIGVRKE